jgi:hypothetical protein
MTIIAYRDGIVAADSRLSYSSSAGGDRHGLCEKLYRVRNSIVALSGDDAGLEFLRWYRKGAKKKVSELLTSDADFMAWIINAKGELWEYGKWLEGEKVVFDPRYPFHAMGCGAKAALGAMHMGATAAEAVEIACRIDPFCGGPIVTMPIGPDDPDDSEVPSG